MNSTMVNHQQDEQGCQVPVWENGETVGSWQNTLLLLWWPLSCIGKWQQTHKRRQYAPTKVMRNGRKARPNTDMPSIWDKTYMAKSSECWFAYGSKPENTNWSTWPSTLVWIPGARRSAGVYVERPHELLSRCMAGWGVTPGRLLLYGDTGRGNMFVMFQANHSKSKNTHHFVQVSMIG